MMDRIWQSLSMLMAALVLAPPAAAEDLVLYAGRSRSLVEPIIERFEEQTGVDVRVRYGRDAQILGTLRTEGAYSPADVYWANTAGALGEATNADLFASLPQSLMEIPAAFQPSSGKWVPITTRFRVLAYNPQAVTPEDLPGSVLELPDLAEFKGRVGWTPSYSSFQDFVTALRVAEGEAAARQWLTRMQELEPKAYSSNTPMLEALLAGEIDIALTNHYYVYRFLHGDARTEGQPKVSPEQAERLAMYHFEPGDVGNLALVTGAGVLEGSDNKELAHRFIRHLLSEQTQRYAAETVHEYPVVSGVEVPDYMTPADRMLKSGPELDFERLRELAQTLELMREVGLF